MSEVAVDLPKSEDDSRIEGYVTGLTDRVPLAKVHYFGNEGTSSSNIAPEVTNDEFRLYETSGLIEPPYDPGMMCKLFEHSNSLRQNVDAYATNIDAFGHRFEPVVDLDGDDAFEQVRDSMYLETIENLEANGETVDYSQVEMPTDDEVEARIEKLRFEMRIEKAKLKAFFDFCCLDESFISLRQKTRQDKEIMGNAYWEVLRNGEGVPVQFNYAPGFAMRLSKQCGQLVPVAMKIKKTPFTVGTINIERRFRLYAQLFEGRTVYFKEFGDPRIVSAQTGAAFKTVAEMKEEEKHENVATEILHFSIHSPRSPYGVPRWIGTLLSVLGSRQSEEVNFLYFENKGVPPMAILVSGGRLSASSVEKIESHIKNRIKGRKNFHSILIIEAEPSGNAALDAASGRMKIEIVPLMNNQQADALFQTYDERNIDKIGMAFRMPRMLRGDIRDFNRSTSEAALEFAEMQVFSPERESFDWVINRKILPELGIRFWLFDSNAPTTRNPFDMAEIVNALVKNSVLTPEEAREFVSAILNRDLKKIDELWTKIPPELLKAGILPEGEEPPPEEPGAQTPTGEPPTQEPQTQEEGDEGKEAKVVERSRFGALGKRYAAASKSRRLRGLARDLVELRSAIEDEADRAGKKRIESLRETMATEVVQIPAEEFAQLFEPEE